MFLPKIYPITDTKLTGLSHTEQVKSLIAGGAGFIQLREKYALSGDFYESAKDVLDFARSHQTKIIINDRVDIALALKADGVHLGQNDLPPEKAREILGGKAIIGFSTHTVRQAAEALKLPIDYIAIGPVFPTKTKENPDEIVGIERVERVREVLGEFPLVAIGGITFDNFKAVLKAGADSVAIISGILTPPESIEQNFRRFKY
jgi:thiamine-phosphate pyrophosphorylase